MSINAIVRAIVISSDSYLELTGEERGQNRLYFDYNQSPKDINLLKGKQIWGGSESILFGEVEIAKRKGYTGIIFTVDSIEHAIAKAELIYKIRKQETDF